ncbi:MAG: glycosyltransferase family 4 protein [Candidatus Nitronauta litoralis]|uniref:Glycosyltransferase family 4 protein n=1 Tax=Candidatus Nitronauta litoralis TaxID=2705533 RepID=A0A7T0BVF6_9BACT|nr:MAG: glycosyltransferase family 4 protein [Candidatus Nitronauta litoralis]
MKVLHAYNRHRGIGGSDNAWDETIRISREGGLEIGEFSRNSRDIVPNILGKAQAFFSGLYSKSAVEDFDRHLDSFKPDVVHAHELYPLISPWILKRCAERKIPAVFTCYDYRMTCAVVTHFHKGKLCLRCKNGKEWWAVLKNCRSNVFESLAYALRNRVARTNRLFIDNVSQFIVLSDFPKQWLINEVGIAPERVSVNPCSLKLPEETGDPAKGDYVAFAGRFASEKGVDLLVEAARKAKVPVKLAGDADTHPAIKEGDSVECLMIRGKEELSKFYRNARMVVVPSIWYETFGLVAAEAMSYGIPVVASRFGALMSTVKDGVSGLLFEMNNADDLAEKITTIWNDPDLAKKLGEGGRREVKERFDPSLQFSQLVEVYEKAIASPIHKN